MVVIGGRKQNSPEATAFLLLPLQILLVQTRYESVLAYHTHINLLFPFEACSHKCRYANLMVHIFSVLLVVHRLRRGMTTKKMLHAYQKNNCMHAW